MELVIWRHGETDCNAAGIWQGRLDTELNARGRQQAEAAAEELARGPVDVILSSPLRRARATAQALAERVGLDVVELDGLMEIDVGQWQGLQRDQVVQRWPDVVAAMAAGEDPPRGVTGERAVDAGVRAEAAVLPALERVADGARVVVCGHGVTSRMLVSRLTGIDPKTMWTSIGTLGNAHWGVLSKVSDGWSMASWNHGVLPSVRANSDR